MVNHRSAPPDQQSEFPAQGSAGGPTPARAEAPSAQPFSVGERGIRRNSLEKMGGGAHRVETGR